MRAVALIAAAVLGCMIGTGQIKLLIVAAAIGVLCAIAWFQPLAGVIASAISAVTVPLLVDTVALHAGPLSVHWTDIALVLAVICAAASRARGTKVHAFRLGVIAVSPALLVLALSAGASLFSGEHWQAVGVGARILAGYMLIPLFVQVTESDRALRQVVRLVHVIAVGAAALVLAGNLNSGVSTVIASVTGSRTVLIPGEASVMARVVLPGMALVPLALALLVGALMYGGQSARRWYVMAGIALYAGALLVTFGRGMWVWTALSLGAALLLRVEARVVVRVAALCVSLLLVVLIADAALGRTPEMPQGLLSLTASRMTALMSGDANIAIRRVEDTEVVRQTTGHEFLGVGLTEPIGVNMGSDETGPLFTVHNSYYATYGRLGLAGIAALLWMCALLLALGSRAIRRADGAVLVVAFGAFTGIVRAILSAWTQTDLTSSTGIVALAICAALLMNAECVATSAPSDGLENAAA